METKTFFSRLFHIALPIILQQLVSSSLNLVGGMMIGQLGETTIAGVGLANQITFLLTLLLFGVSSGTAIFTAQLWGTRDVPNIRRVLGLCLAVAGTGAALFTLAAEAAPAALLGLYTRDPAVIAVGAGYLRVMALGYLPMAGSFALASTLRSTGDVRTPLVVSMGALSLSTVLGYALIFGQFGLPRMGATGAAAAACVARVVDLLALGWLAHRRKSPAAASPRELASVDRAFARTVLARALPVIAGEMLWSLGITTYNAVYARIGTEAIAAINIVTTIEGLAFVMFIGISDACAILVGHEIGAGHRERAYRYAGGSLALAMGGAMAMGVLIALGARPILTLYKVSPQVVDYARQIFTVVAATLWIRVSNMVLIVGIMRSGGDTRFAFVVDAGSVWLVGVPMALVGAFVLHWPVYQVYLLIMAEEVVKWLVGVRRYFSRRWINDVARAL